MKQSRSINIQHMDPVHLMEEDLMEHYCLLYDTALICNF